jgi:hypothetical protein
MAEKSILEVWDVDEHYFTDVVTSNPSLRGMILGYIAERKLHDIFVGDDLTDEHRKDDDHDRSKKGDLVLTYKGEEIVLEVKSLQTNTIEVQKEDGSWIKMMLKELVGRKPSDGFKKNGEPKLGKPIHKMIVNPEFTSLSESYRERAQYRGAFQCDASDKRTVTLDNGEEVTTTLLKVGEFDVIAAGIFGFRNKWEFGFALNKDLPKSDKYGENSKYLIASLVNVSLPLESPFSSNPYEIFDKVIENRKAKT